MHQRKQAVPVALAPLVHPVSQEETMAKRILVALDHTPPPAELLDLVNDAAYGGGGTVRLLHVAPVPENLMGADGHLMAYATQEGARLEAAALDRMRMVELYFTGVPVDSVVRFGDPADAILREAEDFGADLIAMSTRGRTGVSRLIFGSVAQEVARRAPVTVALVRRAAPLA
jgi:nucleotide-binding universal stress UspA family protein